MKILISSGLSAFFLCKLSNQPFFNPSLYSHKYLLDKMKIVTSVGTQITVNYNVIYFLLARHYLHEDCIYTHHRIFQNIKFIFLLELIAYTYHRLSHRIPYLYNKQHSVHHRNIEIYPIDFLEFDITDNIAQTLYINLPLYFVPMNRNDYSLIYYIYATCAFLIHSDILTNDHIIHHKYFKYNYSLLIPVFDVLFGTYRRDVVVEIIEDYLFT
jgi:sterol desaturase/sphingolipid hydroxylase (fatty acid hydroxylase superfamily)